MLDGKETLAPGEPDSIHTLTKPLGLLLDYCHTQPRELLVDTSRPNFISGHYHLLDEDGNVLLKSDGKIGKGKSWTDASGAEIFHSSTSACNSKTVVTMPDGKEIMWVQPNVMGGYSFQAEFVDISGTRKPLAMSGSWKENSELLCGEDVLAKVFKDKYMSSKRRVQVAGNVDCALVFVAVICYAMMVRDTSATIAAIAS